LRRWHGDVIHFSISASGSEDGQLYCARAHTRGTVICATPWRWYPMALLDGVKEPCELLDSYAHCALAGNAQSPRLSRMRFASLWRRHPLPSQWGKIQRPSSSFAARRVLKTALPSPVPLDRTSPGHSNAAGGKPRSLCVRGRRWRGAPRSCSTVKPTWKKWPPAAPGSCLPPRKLIRRLSLVDPAEVALPTAQILSPRAVWTCIQIKASRRKNLHGSELKAQRG
jgi:hypothetical protein